MKKIILMAMTAVMLFACSNPTLEIKDNNLDVADTNAAVQQIIDGSKDPSFDPRIAAQATTALPDLTVSSTRIASSYTMQAETFSATSCTVKEGGFAAGTYRTLRFDAVSINNGSANLSIGSPTNNNSFQYAPCHQHYHFRHFAKYELIPVNADGSLGTAVLARKLGFCMMDNYYGGRETTGGYFNCNNQGISKGWGDIYKATLQGQLFLLNEPGNAIQPGTYKLRITINPTYYPAATGDVCPVPQGNGTCRMFNELDYSNNVGEATINITYANLGLTAPPPPPPPPPAPTGPCTACDPYTGSLTLNANAYAPSQTGVTVSVAKNLEAWLTGPTGTDYDLFLEQLDPSTNTWTTLQKSDTNTSSEYVSYAVPAGTTYRWRFYSYAGTGTYNAYIKATDVSSTAAPCTNCTPYSGSLALNTNGFAPNQMGVVASATGNVEAWLTGPASTDFDLYLEQLDPSTNTWSTLQRSASYTSSEHVIYSVTAGVTYRWRAYSYTGTGAYTIYIAK